MNKQSQQTNTPQELSNAVVVGIDWADTEHVVCVIDQNDRPKIGTLEQSPEAIDEWMAELGRRFPGKTIAIAGKTQTSSHQNTAPLPQGKRHRQSAEANRVDRGRAGRRAADTRPGHHRTRRRLRPDAGTPDSGAQQDDRTT